MTKFHIGIDIGGTFTDAAVVEGEGGRTVLAKSPSTPGDYLDGVMAALGDAAAQLGISLPELLRTTDLLAHSTTITSNVLWTRSGAKVGLVATRGFADQILIMRGIGRVAGLSLAERRHYRNTDKPEPLVPRSRIVEVVERVDFTGEAIVPLNEESARISISELIEKHEIESLSIGLLWSFKNPSHEHRIREIAAELAPEIPVSLSSDLSGRLGEYERTATAVLNAYVSREMVGYLERLTKRLKQAELQRPPLIVQSDGGLTPVKRVMPVRTVESGPAVGVAGAARLSEELSAPNLIATDVGGTTFKVALIEDGGWHLADETVITQYHVHVPMVDVVSIGAGGGSIAWEDEGRLRVGPRSAGAKPGPACYGTGGKEPTVTDADLVLGVLNPANFLGGRLTLDPDAARRAFERTIAPRFFGGDPIQAAAGVRSIMDAQMADLIRKVTLERGRDLREFALLAYGGAGPAHACEYAAEAGISEIIVPYYATVLSAFGAAAGGVRYTLERSLTAFPPGGFDVLEGGYVALETEGADLLEQAGVPSEKRRFERWCAMRWRRQVHSLRVPFPGGAVGPAAVEEAVQAFTKEYAARYGEGAAYTEAGVEVTRIWIDALGPSMPTKRVELRGNLKGKAPIPVNSRQIFWLDGWIDTPIFNGPSLSSGTQIDGPAIIEHPGTTIALTPGSHAIIDDAGHTHIRLDAELLSGGIS